MRVTSELQISKLAGSLTLGLGIPQSVTLQRATRLRWYVCGFPTGVGCKATAVVQDEGNAGDVIDEGDMKDGNGLSYH